MTHHDDLLLSRPALLLATLALATACSAEPRSGADASPCTSCTDDGAAGSGGGSGECADCETTAPLPPCPEAPAGAKYVTPQNMQSVLASLAPGETMVLRDGTYPPMVIRDRQGQANAPFRVLAENERQPLIQGGGYEAALRIAKSSHWEICGLRFENIDEDGASGAIFGAMAGRVTGSHHIVLRRNIFRKPNAFGNNAALKLEAGTHDSLVEDNEVYDFHRNGIAVFNGPGQSSTRDNVVRRNYVNPRGTMWKGRRWGPNYGIVTYRAVDTIVENNILEYTMEAGDGARTIQNTGSGNRFYGNIVINARHGWGSFYHDTTAVGGLLESNLVIGAKQNGAYTHSVKDFVMRNNTFINPGKSGVLVTNSKSKPTNFTGVNNLVVRAGGAGYAVSQAASFGYIDLQFNSGWQNASGTYGAGTGSRTNVVEEQDPGFAGTFVFVPEGSPYKGAGQDGADVGANILYRYRDGELTEEALWDRSTGAFVHGAVISGVNDVEGHSVFDVHERLGVSPQTLPSDY